MRSRCYGRVQAVLAPSATRRSIASRILRLESNNDSLLSEDILRPMDNSGRQLQHSPALPRR